MQSLIGLNSTFGFVIFLSSASCFASSPRRRASHLLLRNAAIFLFPWFFQSVASAWPHRRPPATYPTLVVAFGLYSSSPQQGASLPSNVRGYSNSIAQVEWKRDHIDKYFAQYPAFDYDPNVPCFQEFSRLVQEQKWTRKQRTAERQVLREAMVEQFNVMYGKDVESLSSLQSLCHALGGPVPDNITECQEVRSAKCRDTCVVD